MGLDTTHGAFSGGYGTFNRFRALVAKAIGGSFPPHERPLICSDGDIIVDPSNDRFYVPGKWETFKKERPGIAAFLVSNDCEGSFDPIICKQMGEELRSIIPEIEKLDDSDGKYADITRRYIAGCLLAYSKSETLVYG